jgi:hypothetical protein
MEVALLVVNTGDSLGWRRLDAARCSCPGLVTLVRHQAPTLLPTSSLLSFQQQIHYHRQLQRPIRGAQEANFTPTISYNGGRSSTRSLSELTQSDVGARPVEFASLTHFSCEWLIEPSSSFMLYLPASGLVVSLPSLSDTRHDWFS